MVSNTSSLSSFSSLTLSSLSSSSSIGSPKPHRLSSNDSLSTNSATETSMFCFELMSLMHLEHNSHLWKKIQNTVLGESCDIVSRRFQRESLMQLASSLPHNLWYMVLYIRTKSDRIITFVEETIGQESKFLSGYLRTFEFSELYLDNVFGLFETAKLPVELFIHCPSVRLLSLKNNSLRNLPPEIGYLTQLEILYLTHNRLENWAIPHTLTFCKRLHEIYLDNNLLDALPALLLEISSLRTVHRHGNHNYFKSTFMLYHTDVNGRILESTGRSFDEDEVVDIDACEPKTPMKLEQLCAKAVVSFKLNFFLAPTSMLPLKVKNYLSLLSSQVNLCGSCSSVSSATRPGFKVFTFKNPYLGNTCVPFLHWACSINCANKIEIPARCEQLQSAKEQDRRYELYVRESTKGIVDVKKRRKKRRRHRHEAVDTQSQSYSSCRIL